MYIWKTAFWFLLQKLNLDFSEEAMESQDIILQVHANNSSSTYL